MIQKATAADFYKWWIPKMQSRPEDAGEWSCVVDPNFGARIGHIFDVLVVDGSLNFELWVEIINKNDIIDNTANTYSGN